MKRFIWLIMLMTVVCLAMAFPAMATEAASAAAETAPTGVIGWITTNWPSIILIISGIISTASVIVKLTPTTTDDTWLARIKGWLKILSLNVDG